MMIRKRTSPKPNDGKETNKTIIYAAVIGVIGTLIVALIGILNTRTQILLPVSLTQTAQVLEREKTPLESTPTQTPYMNGLLFGGQVVESKTGEFPNDRLVVLFLKDKEIARTVTSAQKLQIKGNNSNSFVGTNGVMDGVFYLSVPNTYELSISDLSTEPYIFPFIDGKIEINSVSYDVLSTWMYPLNENEVQEFFIPVKNTRYSVFVVPGDVAQLPREIQVPGSLALRDKNKLVAINPAEPQVTQQPLTTGNLTKFKDIETTTEVSYKVTSVNNCNTTSDSEFIQSHTFIHQIIDDSGEKLHTFTDPTAWQLIVSEIERRYGITENEVISQTVEVFVPAGQHIETTFKTTRIWDSGTIFVVNENGEIPPAHYRILKNIFFGIEKTEQKSCP